MIGIPQRRFKCQHAQRKKFTFMSNQREEKAEKLRYAEGFGKELFPSQPMPLPLHRERMTAICDGSGAPKRRRWSCQRAAAQRGCFPF